MKSDKIAVVTGNPFLLHKAEGYHIENPERLEAIMRVLNAKEWHSSIDFLPLRDATLDELLANHSLEYIRQIEECSKLGWSYLTPDTYVNQQSFAVARLAAGSCIALADDIMRANHAHGLAMIRPPGHHAERDEGKGFCLFNNVAVVAHFLLDRYGLERILIVDWDLHHGNGTQHSFYRDKRVLYFSTHQYPFYPGTGWISDIGEGDGLGYTINLPFPQARGDSAYLQAFDRILKPVMSSFKPQFVLVSNGLDMIEDDPIGSMKVSFAGLAHLCDRVSTIAREWADGRLLHVLEGGYSVRNLKQATRVLLESLSGKVARPELRGDPSDAEGEEIIERVIATIKPYWPLL